AESRIDGAPAFASVGALEDCGRGEVGRRVDGGRGLGVNGQGQGEEVGHARVDGTPRGPAVSALEDAAALGARVEGGGGLGVDGEREDSLAVWPGVSADLD